MKVQKIKRGCLKSYWEHKEYRKKAQRTQRKDYLLSVRCVLRVKLCGLCAPYFSTFETLFYLTGGLTVLPVNYSLSMAD